MTDIRPTNTCFDDALEYLEWVAMNRGLAELHQHELVHGICLMPPGSKDPEGTRFAHAWVERDVRPPPNHAQLGPPTREVLQAGFIEGKRAHFWMPREFFDRVMQPQEETHYTIEQAWEENRRSNTYGPWKPEYEALCKQRRAG
jgi:hypothetical protein